MKTITETNLVLKLRNCTVKRYDTVWKMPCCSASMQQSFMSILYYSFTSTSYLHFQLCKSWCVLLSLDKTVCHTWMGKLKSIKIQSFFKFHFRHRSLSFCSFIHHITRNLITIHGNGLFIREGLNELWALPPCILFTLRIVALWSTQTGRLISNLFPTCLWTMQYSRLKTFHFRFYKLEELTRILSSYELKGTVNQICKVVEERNVYFFHIENLKSAISFNTSAATFQSRKLLPHPYYILMWRSSINSPEGL